MNIKCLGRISFDVTNYSNRVDVMSKPGLNVQNSKRYMNVIFRILPDQEGRNFTGSEVKQNNLLKRSINVCPKYILLQGYKIERVTLKCKHGKNIFIEMNSLQNGI